MSRGKCYAGGADSGNQKAVKRKIKLGGKTQRLHKKVW